MLKNTSHMGRGFDAGNDKQLNKQLCQSMYAIIIIITHLSLILCT